MFISLANLSVIVLLSIVVGICIGISKSSRKPTV